MATGGTDMDHNKPNHPRSKRLIFTRMAPISTTTSTLNGFGSPAASSSPARGPPSGGTAADTMSSNAILFDASKSNQVSLNEGLRFVNRLLKNRWRVSSTSKEHLSLETLATARLVVLAGPQERYNEAEFNALRQFVDQGGNLLVLLGEGGEQTFNTNINFLLEEYGIMINSG